MLRGVRDIQPSMTGIKILIAASIRAAGAVLKNLKNLPTPHSNVGF
jgi:hypothetical protein